MSPRRLQRVTVPTIQDRTKTKSGAPTGRGKPWVVRWKIEGKEVKPRYFALKAQAEQYRARLMVAISQGEQFDKATGEPVSWAQSDETCAVWAARWIDLEYGASPERTQQAVVEALERALPRLVSSRAPAPPRYPPTGDPKKDEPSRLMREYVRDWLCNKGTGEPPAGSLRQAQEWMAKWSLPLADVDKETAKRVYAELHLNLDGTPASAWTTKRHRSNVGALFAEALELELIPKSPWPSARIKRKQRAAERTPDQFRPELIMTPMQFRSVLLNVPTHQPSSRRYVTFFATMYLAGLRPHEVHPLTDQHLVLPMDGWGTIHVRLGRRSASKRWQPDGPIDVAQPKTGGRDVPIPPELVSMLREHIEQWGPGPLFRSAPRAGRTGGPLTQSNVNRVWTRAKQATFVEDYPKLKSRVYDLRHANASNLLAAGVPLEETARRLGHSIETLVSIYAKSFAADITSANQRIEERLAGNIR
jgi:integrase